MANICSYDDNEYGVHGEIHNHSDSRNHNLNHLHNHDHSNSSNLFTETFQTEKKLKLAFLLTLVILAVEFTGALLSKSMALYSESGHVLVDASSLFLAWFAQIQVRKSPSEKKYLRLPQNRNTRRSFKFPFTPYTFSHFNIRKLFKTDASRKNQFAYYDYFPPYKLNY